MESNEHSSDDALASNALHFVGETVVSRGEWKMNVPLDFHLVLWEDADPGLSDKAGMILARFYTEKYVRSQDDAFKDAIINFDDD